ncbi:MAG: DUF3712 domain-containing protein, partial [Bradyrhizobium sp.]|nr:DUF3712 domain-containing protein [Bradyrhizobium sp.]
MLLTGCAVPAHADDAIVDVHGLPRLDGAVEDTSRPDRYRVVYRVPMLAAAANPATQQLLAADGWVRYVRPLDERSALLNYKKGKQGLTVYLSGSAGHPGQSDVTYSPQRIYADLPFADGAVDLVFDETRLYLSCVVPMALDAAKALYAKDMIAIGWKPLAPEAAARWPNADLSETMPGGVRAFYGRDDNDGSRRQSPVMLTLTRRDDGRTNVEVRVAPFALPAELEAGEERAGLPMPKPTKWSQSLGGATSPSRQAKGAVIAELPAVLAFYTRELPARGWRIEAAAPGTANDVTLKVASAEETGTLRLSHNYDLTMVELSVRADPTIHLGELTSTPHLDKTIKLPGLNNLKGFGITDLTVMLPPKDGKNIKGTLNLPNSGVLTLEIGNLTLNLLSGKIRLGEITIYDLALPPGNNSCAFDGMLFLDTLGPNLATILADQAGPLGRGVIELNATGNATVVNGVHIP